MLRESVTASGTAAMSLYGGTKGACRHVSTPTLKSVMELKDSEEDVL
jgi:hypothetical protein